MRNAFKPRSFDTLSEDALLDASSTSLGCRNQQAKWQLQEAVARMQSSTSQASTGSQQTYYALVRFTQEAVASMQVAVTRMGMRDAFQQRATSKR